LLSIYTTTSRTTLFPYTTLFRSMKQISFLRDKLFTRAKDLGELDDKQAQQLWSDAPDFHPIPAYVAGFVAKPDLNLPVDQIEVEDRKSTRLNSSHVASSYAVFCL